jgi:hypothetical protein
MIFNSDRGQYGGHRRLQQDQEHLTGFEGAADHKRHFLSLYLPTRTAQVLQRIDL